MKVFCRDRLSLIDRKQTIKRLIFTPYCPIKIMFGFYRKSWWKIAEFSGKVVHFRLVRFCVVGKLKVTSSADSFSGHLLCFGGSILCHRIKIIFMINLSSCACNTRRWFHDFMTLYHVIRDVDTPPIGPTSSLLQHPQEQCDARHWTAAVTQRTRFGQITNTTASAIANGHCTFNL